MEDYKVLKEVGKSARGCVYLVEHKMEEGEMYALKRMECLDEREAAKACKEVMTLRGLQHDYLCKYKDSFLSWDKEVEAMLLCVVMEYCRNGDLDSKLRLRRSNRQFVEESVAKKWLGQLIEALHFVHKCNFIHRNLKPSNIFIREDLSLSLGDFGLSAVMEGTCTVPGTAVGRSTWMAPEILEALTPRYDQRSDVWSLGCTMLCVVTCGSLDQSQINRVLCQMKKDPKVLEDTMDQIAKMYSKEMCQLLRSLLRRAYRQRPTISELVKEPFVQECLSLTNSPLCVAKETEEKAPLDAPMCPRNGNLEEVLVYMEEQAKNKRSQFDALRYLNELVKEEDTALTFGDGGKELVLGTMNRFPTSLDIQLSALEVLTSTASQDDLLYSEEGVSPICLAIRSHKNSKQLQIQALSLLASLVCNGGVADAVGKMGGVQDILSSLRNFPLCPDVAGSCCVALWGLSLQETNRKLIAYHEGVMDLCKSLQQHMVSPEIVDAALSALWSLSIDDDSTAMMSSVGAVEIAITALRTHPKETSIAKFGLSLLTSLVDSDEATAFQIVHTESGCEGVPVVLETMRAHLCNTEVIGQALMLLQSCSRYVDICEELTSRKAVDVLCCIQTEHAMYKDLSALAGVVASQLMSI